MAGLSGKPTLMGTCPKCGHSKLSAHHLLVCLGGKR